ncbi:MAG: DUF3667 domain-containing protein [Thermomonas sp.]
MTDSTTPPENCRNCGTPLLGPHCYRCGQPVSGLVRPLGNLFGDVLDNVFNIDTRIVRTLGPLLAKPGFLTSEYFSGRQVRYVTPVRLFFFLCIFAFFVGSMTMSNDDVVIQGDLDNNPIASATTEAQVIKLRDAELLKVEGARKALPAGPGKSGMEVGLRGAERVASGTANARIKQLRAAAAKGEPVPPTMDEQLSFGDQPWDPKSNPVHIPGAPVFADTWFNDKIARAKSNLRRMKTDPASYKDAFLGAIPTALFVLVPLFALLLKVLYLFKRRLYMEHLVVALHSHAFMSLELLLIFAMLGLQHLVPTGSFLANAAGLMMGLLIAWIPLYLLLMQKRVYAQGWAMTLLKFFVLGTVYSILLSLAIAGAAAASLVWM